MEPFRGFMKRVWLPWPGGSVACSIVPYTKGCGFNSRSEHIPRLRIDPQLRYLWEQPINVSLSLSYTPPPNKHILWGRLKKEVCGQGAGRVGQGVWRLHLLFTRGS